MRQPMIQSLTNLSIKANLSFFLYIEVELPFQETGKQTCHLSLRQKVE